MRQPVALVKDLVTCPSCKYPLCFFGKKCNSCGKRIKNAKD